MSSCRSPLDVGCKIVAESHCRIEMIGMNTGIASGMEQAVDAGRRSVCMQLGNRKREEIEKGRPSGKRLADTTVQFELMAAGKYEFTCHVVFIDTHLNPRKQLRNPLDFIEHRSLWKLRQIPGRIGQGELVCRGVPGYCTVFQENSLCTGLSCPTVSDGYGNDRIPGSA